MPKKVVKLVKIILWLKIIKNNRGDSYTKLQWGGGSEKFPKLYKVINSYGFPMKYYFNRAVHELSHLAGLVLEHVKSEDVFVLRAREYLYIQKFDLYGNGLNMEPYQTET